MMGLELRGAAGVLAFLHNVNRQVRYGTAQALNDTAKDVQHDTVTRLLPSKFTLRAKGMPWQTPGSRFGWNIKFATQDNLQSTVGTQADWMRLQETGGLKRPNKASGRLAIPSPEWKPKSELMVKARKPAAILKRKRAFIYSGPRMPLGIWQRVGKARLPIRLLFRFVQSSRIRPVLQFYPNASKVVQRVYMRHFGLRVGKALATAK